MAENTFTIKEGVNVSNEVFAIIAGLAATEVEGVKSLAGNLTSDMIPKTAANKLARSVHFTTADDNSLSVKVAINISFGYEIPKVCGQVQDKVKSTIENMTGVSVSEVNVRVASVAVDNK